MSFYTYRTVILVHGEAQDLAVIYKYPNGRYDRELDETIDMMMKRRLPPERILIVCQKGLEIAVQGEYEAMGQATHERLRRSGGVTIAAFNHLGRLEPNTVVQLGSPTIPWHPSENDLDAILNAGMKDIVERTGTRMMAPAGYVFRKPSDNASRVFIRAGNMMKNLSALAVIFHAMTRKIPIEAKRLYIDSFTILSIALNYQRSMADLAKACGAAFEIPTITNFHSYALDPGLTFEATEDYAILISASSSGGLARKLINEHHARPDRVYHLLVFSDQTELHDSAVHFQEEANLERAVDGSFQKVISIPGEDFLASHGDTRTVDIKMAHLNDQERTIYKNPFYQAALGLNLRPSGAYGSAFRPIGIEATTIGSDLFMQWLEQQARIELPASATVAVAADGGKSYRLAQHLVSLIPGSEARSVQVITLSELMADAPPTRISPTSSVLVVCSDECDGESLLAISQCLRSKPHLHRHYVIGHLFPSSARQFKRLKSNLRINGKGKPYGWSVYCVTPVGDESVHQSWLAERGFNYPTQGLPGVSDALTTALQLRRQKLSGAVLTGDELFLPKVNGALLQLQDESVLFEGSYGPISQLTVYVQIAAALQRARDRELHDDRTVLSDELCFQSNPFIDTVIDPDTFSRFNDGVIQAAILRSASAAELNYSRDSKLSRHMLDMFSAMVAARHRSRGEAVLEFMLATFLKKMRFHNDHFTEVERLIAAEPDLNAVWQAFTPASPF